VFTLVKKSIGELPIVESETRVLENGAEQTGEAKKEVTKSETKV